MSKRMNMVGGEGSILQKEVFTSKSWKPIESCGHNGCGFGDIVASCLLSISGSQFGSMHREGKDSLPEPQCTNFSLSPQQVGKWAEVSFGLSFWNFNGGQKNSVTPGHSAPVFSGGCDRAQMLEDDFPWTMEKAHIWGQFFPLSLWQIIRETHPYLSLR